MTLTISRHEAKTLLATKPRKHKYNAKRTTVDGIKFDSKRESIRYCLLKMRERAGEITHLERQPKFPLKINGELMFTYIADFGYRENGHRIIEDVKGVRTPVYKLKKKIIQKTYHIEIREV